MSEPQKTLTPKTAVIMALLIGESDWLVGDQDLGDHWQEEEGMLTMTMKTAV